MTPRRRLIHPIVALALVAAVVLGVPVPADAATLAFGPEADARVSEGSPGRNYGASSGSKPTARPSRRATCGSRLLESPGR